MTDLPQWLKPGQRIVSGFVVDSNITLPNHKSPFKKRYPISQLQVGESLFVADVKINNIYNTVKYWADKLGAKFTVRTLEEDGIRGVRVWRMK
jgi:hypothetical protein